MQTLISITWGKSNFYAPAGNEPFVWDGSLHVDGGRVISVEQLIYSRAIFGPAVEESIPLTGPQWTSRVKPGSHDGLEGLRLRVEGDASTIITLSMKPVTIRFSLRELIEKEQLRFHAGGKFSGVPVDVFLGPDARPRVSRPSFLKQLALSDRAGWLILPEELSGVEPHYRFATFGSRLAPGGTARASFPIKGRIPEAGECPIRLQMLAIINLQDTHGNGDRWMDIEIRVGGTVKIIHYLFTSFRCVQKLEDLYLSVPWKDLSAEGNQITIKNLDAEENVLIHRVFINASQPSHKEALLRMPSLPAKPALWVGFDTNTLTPENGEMDQLLQRYREEELGNYLLFRLERRAATEEDITRWAGIMAANNFRAANCGYPMDTCDRLMQTLAGSQYLGIHSHEISILIYGWGTPEPLEERAGRTLPECRAAYLRQMGNSRTIGEATPLQHLDYAAGAELLISELPTGHATLLLAGARGAAAVFDKKFWGVHIANHIPRCPADDDMARRNFMLIYQSWLCGARLIYDEESALYAIHDAPYAFSDPLTYERRAHFQSLYHFASNIDLGRPDVEIGFLHGNGDCLVGGCQAHPDVPKVKVWGAMGPETAGWDVGTPERGWELLGTFMPGVWLYPVEQDPLAIRQILSGTPHGQVNLIPMDAPQAKLSPYRLLVLPGWNTMTESIHDTLLTYVREGGHLVLCAAQCTEHISREFLLEKRDFRFFRNGDLRELAGVRLGAVNGTISRIQWDDGETCPCEALPGLDCELAGARVLASSETGKAILVEHKLGKGRVWMLIAGDYWGHKALDPFRESLTRKLVSIHRSAIYLSGETEDIDFHRFRTEGGYRVVLMNTDWTSAGNQKAVTLHAGDLAIPMKVTEGRLTQVLIKNGAAIVFETPPSIVDDLSVEPSGISFKAGGAGPCRFHVVSGKLLTHCQVAGMKQPLIQMDGGSLHTLDFGERWQELTIQLHEGVSK